MIKTVSISSNDYKFSLCADIDENNKYRNVFLEIVFDENNTEIWDDDNFLHFVFDPWLFGECSDEEYYETESRHNLGWIDEEDYDKLSEIFIEAENIGLWKYIEDREEKLRSINLN